VVDARPTALDDQEWEEGMERGTLREEAKQLLKVAYERRIKEMGDVTQVDLAAGAEPCGLSPNGPRFTTLVDFMEVARWVEADVSTRERSEPLPRRVTLRGLQVLKEG
jgi:hypothetical protein